MSINLRIYAAKKINDRTVENAWNTVQIPSDIVLDIFGSASNASSKRKFLTYLSSIGYDEYKRKFLYWCSVYEADGWKIVYSVD